MDGMRRPVGDQPPAVYWRRRLVVAVAAIALVLLLWFLISATLAGGDGEEPGPGSTTSTTPEAQAVDPDDPSRECTSDDLTLTLAASPPEVTVGSMPAFDVSVEHTGATACMLSTSTEGTDVSIRSGEQIYYSTTWCTEDPAFPSSEWILQPGDKEALQATWTGQRVDDSCEVIQDQADAGYYWASVAIGGVPAPEVQFQLIES
ncbi:hypothetical protein [Demequina muriae]|uniref:Ig-like domain-containing protein n=1 Tax=Demequina muriae TaxID=3051664 RepID=A0ABT8GGW2_9MICO|nr:hypothetical protein [Demequina sp. EGI L300058]MDN4480668.1 hypothetical protein [Demequina sp. EGI L300058]